MRPHCVNIQTKASEQFYFHVLLFIMLFVALLFLWNPWMKPRFWSFKWKQLLRGEQHLQVVLFVKLYKVVLTLTSAIETLVPNYSNESDWAALASKL